MENILSNISFVNGFTTTPEIAERMKREFYEKFLKPQQDAGLLDKIEVMKVGLCIYTNSMEVF